MTQKITVIRGDGIGPEITVAAVEVLKKIAARFGHEFHFSEHDIGGIAIDRHGEPLPGATLEACRQADAVLLGAVGGPKWSDPNAKVRPEQGLLAIRKALGLFANLRPVRTHPAAIHASPIKPELLAGVDFVVVRELTGGIYFGDKSRDADSASDLCRYTVVEIERVLRSAFQLARQRRRRLTSVDKANVLETSRLWRDIATRIGREEFPDVELEHQLVDSMAMHLIAKPRAYDVIVADLPKKVTWDQDRLATMATRIREAGDDPTQYLEIAYRVPERRFGAWPDAMREGFAAARSETTGKPVFRLETRDR